MSEKTMDLLDFGEEAVKDVDAKLAILKFGYSWVGEVEREERAIKKTMDLLDFGKEAVKDMDTKLAILKFDYSWVDEVEKEERMMKEEKVAALGQIDAMKKNHQVLNEDNEFMQRQEILDFGEEPVRDLDTKLEILKFSYSWATAVEENERTKQAQTQTLKSEYNTEKKIQKATANKDESKEKMPENPQKVTEKKTEQLQDLLPVDEAHKETEQLQSLLPVDEAQKKTEQLQNLLPVDEAQKKVEHLQNLLLVEEALKKTEENLQNSLQGDEAVKMTNQLRNPLSEDEAQEKMESRLSKLPELLNDERPETRMNSKELEVFRNEKGQRDLKPLTDKYVENEDHFIPRRLFLFEIANFKLGEATQINVHTEPSNVPSSSKDITKTCKPESTISTKKSIRKRIKRFLGFK